jgi:hypothetical protein
LTLSADSRARLFDAAAIGACVVAFLVTQQQALFEVTITGDEMIYDCAFRRAAAHANPYACEGYVYPPLFALIGAPLSSLLGALHFRRALRLASVAALVALVWASLRPLRARPGLRRALLVPIALLLPSLRSTLGHANFGGVVNGLTVVSLLAFESSPVAASAGLGIGLALKPLAAPAWLALLVHAFQDRRRGRGALLISGLAAIASLAVWPSVVGGFFHPSMGPTNPLGMSTARALHCFGIDVSPAILVVASSLAAALYVARARPSARGVALVGLAASFVAIPLVWTHTFSLLVPIQVAAIVIAAERVSGVSDRDERSLRLLALTLALLGATTLLTSEGVAMNAASLPLAVQGMNVLILQAIGPALAIYVVRRDALTRDERAPR